VGARRHTRSKTSTETTVAARRAARLRSVLWCALGLVVGAGIVGVAWASQGRAHSPNRIVMHAPARLRSYVRFEDAKLNRSGRGLEMAGHVRVADRRTARLLSAAYSGASAVAQKYTDNTYENSFLLLAVRAPSPGLVIPYESAALEGTARPTNEVVTYGSVQCQVFNQPTPRGKTPSPSSVFTVACQRSSKNLTVKITGIGTSGPLQNPSAIAQLVDEAWRRLRE
jgi:hypothetical protein